MVGEVGIELLAWTRTLLLDDEHRPPACQPERIRAADRADSGTLTAIVSTPVEN